MHLRASPLVPPLHGLVAGLTSTPFIVPFHFLTLWIVPTLYLAIPHRDRPWLYRARWLVLAFIVIFNFKMITGVSSPNFASAYGVRSAVLCPFFEERVG